MPATAIAVQPTIVGLSKNFDVPAAFRLRDDLLRLTDRGGVILDLSTTQDLDPFAVAVLFESLAGSRRWVRVRGFSDRHRRLLEDLGLDEFEAELGALANV